MRPVTRMAALTVFAAATLAAPAAFAGFDEAGENSFWSHQTAAQPGATEPQANVNERYRATYGQPATSPSVQKDPPYFYHAMGTMGEQ